MGRKKYDAEFAAEVGRNLRKARVERGLSVVQAAKAMNRTRSTIYKTETGVSIISVDTLVLFCNAYGVTPNDILPKKLTTKK